MYESPYKPISDYGVIGDLRTVALVGLDGSIDWCCPPDFDSPSAFGALLDVGKGGRFRIMPIDVGTSKQMYLPETNVLLTRSQLEQKRRVMAEANPSRSQPAPRR